MKVTVVSSLKAFPQDIPFVCYKYEESQAQLSNYINIKEILKNKSTLWLDELEQSFCEVAKRFVALTRWFWVTPMSRLDARPWGQEYIIKPLIFARALSDWMDGHPQVSEIVLVGAPPFVGVLLKEFNPKLKVQRQSDVLYFIFLLQTMVKQTLKALWLIVDRFQFVRRFHIFQKPKPIDAKIIALFELVEGDVPTQGHSYFYGSLLESPAIQENLSYGCVDHKDCARELHREKNSQKSSHFFLLDYTGRDGLYFALGINILLLLVVLVISFFRMGCSLEGRTSYRFWPIYLLSELGRLPCFINICSYFALKKILKQGVCQQVIYPYEEKGIERAFLFACREKNIKAIGYIPHPQHRLTLALRDGVYPMSPKPNLYAVCGPMYVDYLKSWGRKDANRIHVWGSGKVLDRQVPEKLLEESLQVLVFISHPNELRVFASWLRMDKRLTQDTFYFLRIYKSCLDEQFDRELKSLLQDFPCVEESARDMWYDLSVCHAVVFCATSAGIIAARSGRLSIHLCLDDFFAINPCFDDFSDIPSFESAVNFGNYLQEIRSWNESMVQEVTARQALFAQKIWCSKQLKVIEEDLLCDKT